MSPRAGRCPSCGEPVSPFAAGCAICGADLEAHRSARAARQARRPSLPRLVLPLPSLGEDTVVLVILAVLVLFAPVLALVVLLFLWMDPARAGSRPAFLALGAAAVAVLAIPGVRFGVWQLLA